MLRLDIHTEEQESFDERTSKFVTTPAQRLGVVDIEHSLVSLSKWEAIHQIPFLSSGDDLTAEQILDYLMCMVVTPGVDPRIMAYCSEEQLKAINDYMNSNHTATTFREVKGHAPGPKEVVTSELIYFWMVSFKIPFQPSETWHLGSLLALIKVCSVKNSKPKKRSPADMRAERQRANAERRAKYGTSG